MLIDFLPYLINNKFHFLLNQYISGGVHLVWATQDEGSYFETYYSRLTPTTPYQWVESKNVTDHVGGWSGGKPSVTLSSNRVHVSFNTETGTSPFSGTPADAQSRDKVGSEWEDPQLIVFQAEQSTAEKTITNESNLFLFYSEYNTNGASQWSNLNYKTRGLNDLRWSEATELAIRILEVNHAFNLGHTFNNDVHLLYDGSIGDDAGYLIYRFFTGLNWSNPIIMNYENTTRSECSRGFTSVSNDLFVIWTEFENGKLLYRHYDAAPLAPANFQLTNSGSPYYHPYLSWSAVNEPDVRIKNNGLRIDRSIEVNGQWSSWSEIAAISGTSTNYTDGDIINATGGGNGRVKYRIRSYDNGGNFSPYTSEIIIRYGISMEKEVVSNTNNIIDYNLDQNYPNPFNPSTSIIYQIKDKGFVSLKIYDMLGKEIVELVNETQETGEYSVNFDASNLPSGVYIYSLRVNDFVQNHKMLMIK